MKDKSGDGKSLEQSEIGSDGLTKEQREHKEAMLRQSSSNEKSMIRKKRQQHEREIDEYFENLREQYRHKVQKKSVARSTLEGGLNLAAAAVLLGASYATGGVLPGAIALGGAALGMIGWLNKSPVSIKTELDRKRLAYASLTGSFIKRTDDISRPIMMLTGLTTALTTLAVPFAAVAFIACSIAFFTSAYNQIYYPEKANTFSLVGNLFNLLGTGTALGIAIGSLVVGAALLANPIGLGVAGGLIVLAATIKLAPDIKEFFFPKKIRTKTNTFDKSIVYPEHRKSLINTRKKKAANNQTKTLQSILEHSPVVSTGNSQSFTHLSSRKTATKEALPEEAQKQDDSKPAHEKKGIDHRSKR